MRKSILVVGLVGALGPGGPEGGLLIAGSVDSDTLGLDLFPLYGIPSEGRWNPYVGFGARLEYVDYETSFLNTARSDTLVRVGLGWRF